jgi:hypothetical protein
MVPEVEEEDIPPSSSLWELGGVVTELTTGADEKDLMQRTVVVGFGDVPW